MTVPTRKMIVIEGGTASGRRTEEIFWSLLWFYVLSCPALLFPVVSKGCGFCWENG